MEVGKLYALITRIKEKHELINFLPGESQPLYPSDLENIGIPFEEGKDYLNELVRRDAIRFEVPKWPQVADLSRQNYVIWLADGFHQEFENIESESTGRVMPQSDPQAEKAPKFVVPEDMDVEKAFVIMEDIRNKMRLHSGNGIIQLSQTWLHSGIDRQSLETVLGILVHEAGVLRIITHPGGIFKKDSDPISPYVAMGYRVMPLEGFEDVFQKVKAARSNTPNLRTLIGAHDKMLIRQLDRIAPSKVADDEPVIAPRPSLSENTLTIRFDDVTRQVLLNDIFLISTPGYVTENYRFMEYVIENPNRDISLDELNKALGTPLTKSLNKILENLRFTGDLRKAFFKTSKTMVRFTPTRTFSELEAKRLIPLRLYGQAKSD